MIAAADAPPIDRSISLSDRASPLWDLVDRPMMTRILAPNTSPDVRRLHELCLFATLTMALHERVERSILAGDPPAVVPGEAALPTLEPAGLGA